MVQAYWKTIYTVRLQTAKLSCRTVPSQNGLSLRRHRRWWCRVFGPKNLSQSAAMESCWSIFCCLITSAVKRSSSENPGLAVHFVTHRTFSSHLVRVWASLFPSQGRLIQDFWTVLSAVVTTHLLHAVGHVDGGRKLPLMFPESFWSGRHPIPCQNYPTQSENPVHPIWSYCNGQSMDVGERVSLLFWGVLSLLFCGTGTQWATGQPPHPPTVREDPFCPFKEGIEITSSACLVPCSSKICPEICLQVPICIVLMDCWVYDLLSQMSGQCQCFLSLKPAKICNMPTNNTPTWPHQWDGSKLHRGTHSPLTGLCCCI